MSICRTPLVNTRRTTNDFLAMANTLTHEALSYGGHATLDVMPMPGVGSIVVPDVAFIGLHQALVR